VNRYINACTPRPETRFCIAIEEGEACFLGDLSAAKTAYPKAKEAVLSSYVNDSICGTWEKLADAVCQGGVLALSAKGWQAVGTEKSKWAEEITPHMTVESNLSPIFLLFLWKNARTGRGGLMDHGWYYSPNYRQLCQVIEAQTHWGNIRTEG